LLVVALALLELLDRLVLLDPQDLLDLLDPLVLLDLLDLRVHFHTSQCLLLLYLQELM
jgi:hypothetical protein